MIVVDTTVLVYATGAEHPLRQPCRDVLAAIAAGDVAATTSVEVLQEFVHIRSRRLPRGEAVSQATDLATGLMPLLQPNERDLDRGIRELYVQHPRIGAFGAVLAAAVMNRPHLSALVSADRGFADIRGLVHREPGDPRLYAR